MPALPRVAGKWRKVPPAKIWARAGGRPRMVLGGWVRVAGKWRKFHQGSSPQTKTFYTTRTPTGRGPKGGPWPLTSWGDRETILYEGYARGHAYEVGALYFKESDIRAFLAQRRRTTRIRLRLKCLWTYAGSGKVFHIYTQNMPTSGAPIRLGRHVADIKLARGQTAWVTLPTWVGDDIRDGRARGFALAYTGSTSSSYWGFVAGMKTGDISHGNLSRIRASTTSEKPALEITADY